MLFFYILNVFNLEGIVYARLDGFNVALLCLDKYVLHLCHNILHLCWHNLFFVWLWQGGRRHSWRGWRGWLCGCWLCFRCGGRLWSWRYYLPSMCPLERLRKFLFDLFWHWLGGWCGLWQFLFPAHHPFDIFFPCLRREFEI